MIRVFAAICCLFAALTAQAKDRVTEHGKTAIVQDGTDVVVSTKITLNGTEHVLVTNSAIDPNVETRWPLFRLSYTIVQNSHRLVRSQKEVTIEWRLKNHKADEVMPRISGQVVLLTPAEIKQLNVSLKTLVPD